VGLFSLYSGLLLPWLCGTLWLIAVESRFNPRQPPHLLRQAGYGLFLGYALLFFAILLSNSFTGSVSWKALMLFLGVLTGGGGLLVWFTTRQASPLAAAVVEPKNIIIRILTGLLLILLAIHLILLAIDIFVQPLYPWDAWLAWVYRAKAWYLAGGISSVVGTAEWVSSTSVGTYTIDAWMYPLFPSVIPYWAALSLGSWSETLTNLPVLLAGLAIGMALYGQCREYGLAIPTSLLCCYLLYSIPLFGTHIALAGYADIWMAGFTGLGFVAVIRALALRTTTPHAKYGFQMTLGLVMLTIAICVKHEGAVWFLAALCLVMLISCRARVPILIIVALTVAALLGNAIGISHISIPFIGPLGIIDGRLIIPFIGSFALEVHNIWQVYWANFLTMGSWNLLWVLILASLVLSLKSSTNPSSKLTERIGLVFFCIFLATQFFIFGLTDQGIWADTYTAINRLPLHFVPALLFAAFMILHCRMSQRETANG